MAFLKYKDGELVFGLKEHRVRDLQPRTTPFYAYEWSGIESRYQMMKDAFDGQAELHFAMKSNSHPEILAGLAKLGAGVDIVSGGELTLALQAGFPAQRIVFSGVGKTADEIRAALRTGIQQINVESEAELARIRTIASELGVRAPVALRLNPDISAETHPYITTGFRENKFGLEKGAALRCLEILKENPRELHFRGLTLHIGSQLFKLHDYRDALLWVLDFAREVEAAGLRIENLDLGGGLGIYYEADRHDDEVALLRDYARTVLAELAGRDYQLQLEPGRWIVGHSGILVTRVEYVKTTPYKNFLIVDSGMHHLLRPSLYGAIHRVLPLQEGVADDVYDVVGPICESSDFLAKKCPLPVMREGDWLVIADAGAYGFEMGSEYNAKGRADRIVLP